MRIVSDLEREFTLEMQKETGFFKELMQNNENLKKVGPLEIGEQRSISKIENIIAEGAEFFTLLHDTLKL